jgi:acetoin utilization deacetylase AcuC-like enzyme
MIIYHPKYLEHMQDAYHPESPQRLDAILKKLESSNLMGGLLTPEAATKEDLVTVHTPEYVEFVQNYGEGVIDYDTTLHTETYEIAILSAGGGLLAARKSVEENKPYFALIRPPGHHATPGNGGGFCYFNNIAIAAKDLLKRMERIAIIDYDGTCPPIIGGYTQGQVQSTLWVKARERDTSSMFHFPEGLGTSLSTRPLTSSSTPS